jgi:hypothetical protein
VALAENLLPRQHPSVQHARVMRFSITRNELVPTLLKSLLTIPCGATVALRCLKHCFVARSDLPKLNPLQPLQPQ